jgi:hypothetical protein
MIPDNTSPDSKNEPPSGPGFGAEFCPRCGEKGKAVPDQTVKALVGISLRTFRENTAYFFCSTHSCRVVYFSGDGKHTFSLDHVREHVYQKEPDCPDVLVCYCFQYKAGEIQNTCAPDQEAILEDIELGIKAGQCACDLRNPQGSCCLGNIRELFK